jgi:diacylglycerol kinase family enzyme
MNVNRNTSEAGTPDHEGVARAVRLSSLHPPANKNTIARVEAAAMKTPLTYHLLLNARSGSARADTAEVLRMAFGKHGHRVVIDADEDKPLADRVARAAESSADVVVAGGGDGTATALAEAILGTDKLLAVLPLGTANLLARDLGLPLEAEQWVAGLDDMAVRRIDVGEVNGRIFLHKVVIGTIPGIAAAREQIRDRSDIGAVLGFLGHLVRRLERARPMAAEITLGAGGKRFERVKSIAVVNNDYDEGLGQLFSRSCLDGGTLSLYLVRHLSFGDVLRLSAEMLLGNWRNDAALEIEKVRHVSMRLRRPMIKAMIDGEIASLETPLSFQVRPSALPILAPVAPVQAEGNDDLSPTLAAQS